MQGHFLLLDSRWQPFWLYVAFAVAAVAAWTRVHCHADKACKLQPQYSSAALVHPCMGRLGCTAMCCCACCHHISTLHAAVVCSFTCLTGAYGQVRTRQELPKQLPAAGGVADGRPPGSIFDAAEWLLPSLLDIPIQCWPPVNHTNRNAFEASD